MWYYCNNNWGRIVIRWFFLHSHDEEEIMNPVVVVSKAKTTIASKGEDSNEEPSEFEDEMAKELQVP